MAVVLSKRDVKEVRNALFDVRMKWYTIGLELKIDAIELEAIKTLYKDPLSCMTDMVLLWLKSELPTWEALEIALKARCVNEVKVAAEVALQARASIISNPQLPENSVDEDRYRRHLKHLYQIGPIDHNDQLSMTPCEDFINLTVIKDGGQSVYTKATNQGVETVLLSRERIPFDLDSIVGDSKYVLVEGPPGIGKSTMCWELCRQWDNLKSLQKYRIILHVFLREEKIQKAKTLSDIFEDYHDIPQLKERVVDELSKCDGKDVLLILDGFDEMPESIVRGNCLIMRLINCASFGAATRLVTSRPSPHRFPHGCKRVQVLGFTDESKIKYAECAFRSDPEYVLSHFKKFLDCNPVIKLLMCVPLNCAVITQVYPRNMKNCGKQMSNSVTQQHLFIILMRRTMREADKFSRVTSDEYQNLPLEVADRLEKIDEENIFKRKEPLLSSPPRQLSSPPRQLSSSPPQVSSPPHQLSSTPSQLSSPDKDEEEISNLDEKRLQLQKVREQLEQLDGKEQLERKEEVKKLPTRVEEVVKKLQEKVKKLQTQLEESKEEVKKLQMQLEEKVKKLQTQLEREQQEVKKLQMQEREQLEKKEAKIQEVKELVDREQQEVKVQLEQEVKTLQTQLKQKELYLKIQLESEEKLEKELESERTSELNMERDMNSEYKEKLRILKQKATIPLAPRLDSEGTVEELKCLFQDLCVYFKTST